MAFRVEQKTKLVSHHGAKILVVVIFAITITCGWSEYICISSACASWTPRQWAKGQSTVIHRAIRKSVIEFLKVSKNSKLWDFIFLDYYLFSIKKLFFLYINQVSMVITPFFAYVTFRKNMYKISWCKISAMLKPYYQHPYFDFLSFFPIFLFFVNFSFWPKIAHLWFFSIDFPQAN